MQQLVQLQQTDEEYYEAIDNVLSHKPDVIIDDGADMIMYLHEKRPELLANFDNRYGTGQSSLDAIMGTTNMLIAGKNVVVCGYGWCGRGVASRAAGLGANVIVTEVDPIRALEARMDGYRVMKIREAVKIADLVVTVTGNIDIIHGDDFKYMKDGCMLSNSGHFNVEINRQDLEAQSVSCEEVRESIEMFTMKDGRKIYLLADGRLVNLAAARGQGHPAEIMDMSFAVQALSAKYIVENDLSLSVEKAPDSIDDDVARLKLKAMGIEIDDLSERQKDYLSDWREGT